MAKNRMLTDTEKKICHDNKIDTEHVTVEYSDKDYIRLLNFLTRDHIVIHRGDRPW